MHTTRKRGHDRYRSTSRSTHRSHRRQKSPHRDSQQRRTTATNLIKASLSTDPAKPITAATTPSFNITQDKLDQINTVRLVTVLNGEGSPHTEVSVANILANIDQYIVEDPPCIDSGGGSTYSTDNDRWSPLSDHSAVRDMTSYYAHAMDAYYARAAQAANRHRITFNQSTDTIEDVGGNLKRKVLAADSVYQVVAQQCRLKTGTIGPLYRRRFAMQEAAVLLHKSCVIQDNHARGKNRRPFQTIPPPNIAAMAWLGVHANPANRCPRWKDLFLHSVRHQFPVHSITAWQVAPRPPPGRLMWPFRPLSPPPTTFRESWIFTVHLERLLRHVFRHTDAGVQDAMWGRLKGIVRETSVQVPRESPLNPLLCQIATLQTTKLAQEHKHASVLATRRDDAMSRSLWGLLTFRYQLYTGSTTTQQYSRDEINECKHQVIAHAATMYPVAGAGTVPKQQLIPPAAIAALWDMIGIQTRFLDEPPMPATAYMWDSLEEDVGIVWTVLSSELNKHSRRNDPSHLPDVMRDPDLTALDKECYIHGNSEAMIAQGLNPLNVLAVLRRAHGRDSVRQEAYDAMNRVMEVFRCERVFTSAVNGVPGEMVVIALADITNAPVPMTGWNDPDAPLSVVLVPAWQSTLYQYPPHVMDDTTALREDCTEHRMYRFRGSMVAGDSPVTELGPAPVVAGFGMEYLVAWDSATNLDRDGSFWLKPPDLTCLCWDHTHFRSEMNCPRRRESEAAEEVFAALDAQATHSIGIMPLYAARYALWWIAEQTASPSRTLHTTAQGPPESHLTQFNETLRGRVCVPDHIGFQALFGPGHILMQGPLPPNIQPSRWQDVLGTLMDVNEPLFSDNTRWEDSPPHVYAEQKLDHYMELLSIDGSSSFRDVAYDPCIDHDHRNNCLVTDFRKVVLEARATHAWYRRHDHAIQPPMARWSENDGHAYLFDAATFDRLVPSPPLVGQTSLVPFDTWPKRARIHTMHLERLRAFHGPSMAIFAALWFRVTGHPLHRFITSEVHMGNEIDAETATIFVENWVGGPGTPDSLMAVPNMLLNMVQERVGVPLITHMYGYKGIHGLQAAEVRVALHTKVVAITAAVDQHTALNYTQPGGSCPWQDVLRSWKESPDEMSSDAPTLVTGLFHHQSMDKWDGLADGHEGERGGHWVSTSFLRVCHSNNYKLPKQDVRIICRDSLHDGAFQLPPTISRQFITDFPFIRTVVKCLQQIDLTCAGENMVAEACDRLQRLQDCIALPATRKDTDIHWWLTMLATNYQTCFKGERRFGSEDVHNYDDDWNLDPRQLFHWLGHVHSMYALTTGDGSLSLTALKDFVAQLSEGGDQAFVYGCLLSMFDNAFNVATSTMKRVCTWLVDGSRHADPTTLAYAKYVHTMAAQRIQVYSSAHRLLQTMQGGGLDRQQLSVDTLLDGLDVTAVYYDMLARAVAAKWQGSGPVTSALIGACMGPHGLTQWSNANIVQGNESACGTWSAAASILAAQCEAEHQVLRARTVTTALQHTWRQRSDRWAPFTYACVQTFPGLSMQGWASEVLSALFSIDREESVSGHRGTPSAREWLDEEGPGPHGHREEWKDPQHPGETHHRSSHRPPLSCLDGRDTVFCEDVYLEHDSHMQVVDRRVGVVEWVNWGQWLWHDADGAKIAVAHVVLGRGGFCMRAVMEQMVTPDSGPRTTCVTLIVPDPISIRLVDIRCLDDLNNVTKLLYLAEEVLQHLMATMQGHGTEAVTQLWSTVIDACDNGILDGILSDRAMPTTRDKELIQRSVTQCILNLVVHPFDAVICDVQIQDPVSRQSLQEFVYTGNGGSRDRVVQRIIGRLQITNNRLMNQLQKLETMDQMRIIAYLRRALNAVAMVSKEEFQTDMLTTHSNARIQLMGVLQNVVSRSIGQGGLTRRMFDVRVVSLYPVMDLLEERKDRFMSCVTMDARTAECMVAAYRRTPQRMAWSWYPVATIEPSWQVYHQHFQTWTAIDYQLTQSTSISDHRMVMSRPLDRSEVLGGDRVYRPPDFADDRCSNRTTIQKIRFDLHHLGISGDDEVDDDIKHQLDGSKLWDSG